MNHCLNHLVSEKCIIDCLGLSFLLKGFKRQSIKSKTINRTGRSLLASIQGAANLYQLIGIIGI
jgi:hypothetical protein